MKTVDPKVLLLDEINIINSKTDYELIEIEQQNPKFVQAKGIMALRYRKVLDETDPMNVTVKGITGSEMYGAELNFTDNPYSRKPLPGCTGKVAFILADKEKTPIGSLSGESKGWNLEFLASHYGEHKFKIVDEKWDKVVKARYKKILENLENNPLPIKRDSRYDIRGINKPVDANLVKVQVDNSEVNATLQAMQEQINKLIAENKDLKESKVAKKDSDKKAE